MTGALLGVAVGLLLAVGLAGTVIPGLPGVGLIFLGIFLYAWATGFTTISATTLVILGLLGATALAASYAGSFVGTSLGGGKKKAVWGTIAGAAVGFLLASGIGLFVGAFLGALGGALREGQSRRQAVRVALFTIVGILGASVVQFLLGLAMIVSFLVAIWI